MGGTVDGFTGGDGRRRLGRILSVGGGRVGSPEGMVAKGLETFKLTYGERGSSLQALT